MTTVTQSGSGSWLLSSNWEQGTWLLLFRGSGVQGRWGPGVWQHDGLKRGLYPHMTPSEGWWGEPADVMPLMVFGAWKGFQWCSDLVQDLTQQKLPGRWDLEKS